MSREKQKKIILKREQETAVKECFIVEKTVRINTTIWIYDHYLKLSGLFTTQIFYIQLCREVWSVRCDYFLVDIQAHVFFVLCI